MDTIVLLEYIIACNNNNYNYFNLFISSQICKFYKSPLA